MLLVNYLGLMFGEIAVAFDIIFQYILVLYQKKMTNIIDSYKDSLAVRVLAATRNQYKGDFHIRYSQKYFDAPAQMENDIKVFKSLEMVKRVLQHHPEFKNEIKNYLGF